MKKYFLFIGFFLLVLTLYFLFSYLTQEKKSAPSPVFPTPTIFQPDSTLPSAKELEREKDLQQNYADERQKLLEDKPWLLKLPLKSNNCFISYDTEQNEFVVSIYIYQSSSDPYEQRVKKAKEEALTAIKGLGGNATNQKVVFIETKR